MNCHHVLIASAKEQDPVIPLVAAENQDQPCFLFFLFFFISLTLRAFVSLCEIHVFICQDREMDAIRKQNMKSTFK